MRFGWMIPLTVFGTVACQRGESPTKAPADPPAVVIDGEPIARSAFVDALLADQGEAFAKRFVERRLVDKAAAAAGVKVDEAAVDAALEAEIRTLIAGRFGGARSKLEAQVAGYGLSMATWRANRRAYHRTMHLARAAMQAKVPDARVRALFEERFGPGGVRQTVRHILLSTHVAASRLYTRKDFEAEKAEIDVQARAKATAIRQRVLGGGDFAAEAKAHSDDFAAERGGVVGANWAGRYGAAFDDAVGRLDVGQMSPVVAGRRGYHVVQVTGVRKGARYQGSAIRVDFAKHGGASGAADRARQAKAQLDAGTAFAAVAATYTDDEAAKIAGGALGPFGPGRLPAEVDAVLETLPIGQVSAPIRTEAAYLIVRLDKRTFLPGQDKRLVRHVLISTEYDKVKARRIGPNLEAKAKARAEDVLAQLGQGADFAALARSHSEDALTARQGGKITVYRPGKIGPEVDDALKTMKPGARTIVKTRRGFHVVELVGLQKADFAGVEAKLRTELATRRVKDEDVTAWIEGLVKAAKVELKFGG